MIEILWNGRGGQGAFTAARILGAAWALKNERNYALVFPSFGPERRGAPVRAFTKLSDKPINNRSEIRLSDFNVYLDDTLFNDTALGNIKDGGKIILNTTRQYDDSRIVAFDADKIANDILKRPVTNTAMLGVLSAIYPEVTLADIEHAIIVTMPEQLTPGNIEVVRAVREEIT